MNFVRTIVFLSIKYLIQNFFGLRNIIVSAELRNKFNENIILNIDINLLLVQFMVNYVHKI